MRGVERTLYVGTETSVDVCCNTLLCRLDLEILPPFFIAHFAINRL